MPDILVDIKFTDLVDIGVVGLLLWTRTYRIMALPEGVSLVSTSIWTSKFALSENYCPVALITVPSQARTQQPEPASNGLENRCDKLL